MNNPRFRVRLLVSVACAALLLGTSGKMTSAQSGTAPIVLEDFSSERMNGDSPPQPLFQPYTGGSSYGPGQKGSIIAGGIYRIAVPAGQASSCRIRTTFLKVLPRTVSGAVRGRRT
jgi:hypothetical protein